MTHFNLNRILVPIDFSETSLTALDYAETVAKKTNAEILLVHVIENVYASVEPMVVVNPAVQFEYQKEITEQSEKQLDALVKNLSGRISNKVSSVVKYGNVVAELLSVAEENQTGIIVMGTHGVSGFKEYFLGSNAFRLIRQSEYPVLTVQMKETGHGFNDILIPFRDRPHSREKVNYAIDMAELFSSTIHVLGVDTELSNEGYKKIQLEAAQIKKIIEAKNIKCDVQVISGAYVGDVVLEHAKNMKADLIISMADMDKDNIVEYFTGPFAQQIVNHSPIPVLSIKPVFNTNTVDLRFY